MQLFGKKQEKFYPCFWSAGQEESGGDLRSKLSMIVLILHLLFS